MIINRQEFLDLLEMVSPGLSPKELVEQSSCVVFFKKNIITFNDEVCCRAKTSIPFTGAVQAQTLLDILAKIPDDELRVDDREGVFEFTGKGRVFQVIKESKIMLPVENVETPTKWHDLPKEFTEAVEMVSQCVSNDTTQFRLTCVNVTPGWVESCDNMQVLRAKVDTGLKESTIVIGKYLKQIVTLGMDSIAMTRSWLHFQNQAGLIFSIRRYVEDYPDMTGALEHKGGHKLVIPKTLKDVCERAAVFSRDQAGDQTVKVSLRDGKCRVVGEGISGKYKEFRKIDYDGPPIDFLIAPDLLKNIAERYTNAVINDRKLKVSGGFWDYVTVLGQPLREEE